jgi:hypothetical protein
MMAYFQAVTDREPSDGAEMGSDSSSASSQTASPSSQTAIPSSQTAGPSSQTASPSYGTACLPFEPLSAGSSCSLDEFQYRQKCMEEQNRQRKELLAKALADRSVPSGQWSVAPIVLFVGSCNSAVKYSKSSWESGR